MHRSYANGALFFYKVLEHSWILVSRETGKMCAESNQLYVPIILAGIQYRIRFNENIILQFILLKSSFFFIIFIFR